jgi:hypothetical protein
MSQASREKRAMRNASGKPIRAAAMLPALFCSFFLSLCSAWAQSSIGVNQGIVAPSSSSAVTTGIGLAGNGSSGSPIALSTPVAVSNGGTGAVSAGAAAAHNIGAAAQGANSDITSLSGLTTPLSVAQGGSGAAVSGAAAYSNIAGGVAANVNLTGTDAISLSAGNQKLTLTANETLTIQAGSIANTPSATNLYRVQFRICQNATGNFTLAFAPGPGVNNIYWSGAAQPGYTLTPNNGDWYECFYDGANLRCREFMSNVPC